MKARRTILFEGLAENIILGLCAALSYITPMNFLYICNILLIGYLMKFVLTNEDEYYRNSQLNDVRVSDSLLEELRFDSRLQCGALCKTYSRTCFSFAWNKLQGLCRMYSNIFTSIPAGAMIEVGWEHYNVKACEGKPFIPHGMVINAIVTPGGILTGTCNTGYVALSGQVTITCNSDYTYSLPSDSCKLLITSIAIRKPAAESTTIMSANPASVAVDGNRNTNWMAGSCTHTGFGDLKPWWRVDLLDIYYIVVVRILNRGSDSTGIDSSGRLQNVDINIGNSTSSTPVLCGHFAGPGTLAQLVTVQCPPYTVGRVVKISIVTEFLTLCEVDVHVVALP